MAARNRVEIRGTLLGGTEVWSTGVTLGGQTLVDDPATLTAWAEDIVTALEGTTAIGPLTGIMGSIGGAQITSIVTQYYGATGGIAAQGEAVAAIVGTNTLTCPPQVSIVLSMRTNLSGRSRRGRNYWPALAAEVDGQTARISDVVATNLANAWVEMLNIFCNEAPGVSDLIPVVYSPTLDVLTAVSSIQVGDVLDTQRRRRDELIETYSVVPYTND